MAQKIRVEDSIIRKHSVSSDRFEETVRLFNSDGFLCSLPRVRRRLGWETEMVDGIFKSPVLEYSRLLSVVLSTVDVK